MTVYPTTLSTAPHCVVARNTLTLDEFDEILLTTKELLIKLSTTTRHSDTFYQATKILEEQSVKMTVQEIDGLAELTTSSENKPYCIAFSRQLICEEIDELLTEGESHESAMLCVSAKLIPHLTHHLHCLMNFEQSGQLGRIRLKTFIMPSITGRIWSSVLHSIKGVGAWNTKLSRSLDATI